MLMQHVGVGYFGYYRATIYAMKHSVMPEIAKLRMKALHFWEKHGINAAAEAFGVSTRTLYWWRRLLNTGGPEALIPRSKAPLVRRTKQWHPEILKEIRRLRTELPNLGKEQIFIRLKPWCEQRHLPCPSVSTIGRMIAAAHDKMRLIPVRLGPRGKALLIKKRSTKPRRPKHYRPVKTGELIGMDAIELRMGELRRYVITMIDEHSWHWPYRRLTVISSGTSSAVQPGCSLLVSTRSSLTTGKSSWENSTKRCRKLPSGTYGLIPIRRK